MTSPPPTSGPTLAIERTTWSPPTKPPGERGQDGAWRCLMTDIRDAVADSMDGDPLAAVRALEEALLDTGEEESILRMLE